jgi:hypothetical protein
MITFYNLPKKMYEIAQISGLDHILPLANNKRDEV